MAKKSEKNEEVVEEKTTNEATNQEVSTDKKEGDIDEGAQKEEGNEEKKEEKTILSKEEELAIELAETKDKYLRLYSEFENFRRRTNKEKLELIGSAGADILTAILPIVDDFERSQLNIDKADLDTLKEGNQLIQNKLNNILGQKGLKPMEVEKGSAFNPDFHEAITKIPAPEESLKGKVVDVIEKGYFVGEKVIRFAKVVIGD